MRLGAKLTETITKRLNDKDREAAAAMDCSIKVGVCAVFFNARVEDDRRPPTP